ncbi:MAG: hypothetical protein PHE12_01660 [Clostridia bacterium]|nr:hypothetical protein [Clostridia bacterium]
MQIKIQNDLFDIAARLREIDSGYYVIFDTVKKVYQIHNCAQANGTYCLTLPYDSLDARAVEYVKSTRRQYAENIIRQIETHNQNLENQSIKHAAENISGRFL